MSRTSFRRPKSELNGARPDTSRLGPLLDRIPEGHHHFASVLLQSSRDAVFLFGDDGPFLAVNPAACALTGYPEGELLSLTARDLAPSAPFQPPLLWRRFFAAGGEGTLQILRKDGRVTEVEVRTVDSVLPGIHLSSLRDLGSRRAAEAELRFHAGALAQVSDVVVAIDREWRVTYWNQAAERTYRLKSEDVLGKPLSEAYETRWPDPDKELKARDLLASTGRWDGEVFHVTRDGRTLVVEARVSTMKGEGDVPVGFLAVLRDVTERRSAEKSLRASEARLRLLTEQLPLAVWTADRSLVLTSVSGAYFGTNGAREASMYVGKRLRDVLVWDKPGDHPGVSAHLRALAGETASYEFERDGRFYQGEVRPLRDLGDRIVEVVGAGIDVTERKHAEESAAGLARAVQSTGDAVVTEMLDGRVTSWNRAAERLFGYEEAEILGRSITTIVPEDRRGEYEALLDRVGKGERLEQVETERLTKSGRRVDVSITLSPIRDQDGAVVGISKIARDISGAKRAREAVRRSEERLQEALRGTGIVAWEWDPRRDAVTTTSNVAEVYGLPPGSDVATYTAGMRLVHPEDRARHGATVQGAVARKAPYFSQFRIVRPKDGRVVWMEERAVPFLGPGGELLRLSGVVTDVTERKEAETALRASEARFRELADAMPQIVLSARPDGVIDYCNRRWTETTGAPPLPDNAESLGKVLHPDDLGRCVERWNASLRSGEPMEVEYRCWDAGRQAFRWHLGRSVPVRDAAGAVVRWFGTSTDIDDLKRTQEEVRRLNVSLEERVAERTADLEASLRELDTFAYTVAHDLRAPLRAMAGFSDMLAWEYAGRTLDDEGRDYARRISDSARRMDALILDLLTYSRLTREEVDLEPVDLQALAPEVVKEMRGEIDERRGRVETVGPMPVVFAHRTSLRQALTNLVSNALKFVGPAVRPEVRLWSERKEATVRLWVEDNGIGIAPEHRERIFGLFERLHRGPDSFPGTGIGLAIVRRAMERMGGSVGVESAPGGGSRFFLELPLTASDRPHTRRHRAARPDKHAP